MQSDKEIIWQNVLSFFKREYDNTLLNTSMLGVRRVFQICLIAFSCLFGLIMGGTALLTIIIGIMDGGLMQACVFAFITAMFSLYLFSLANRIIGSLSRDYHKEVMDLLSVQQKIFVRECAVALGVGPKKAKNILEELCDIGLCELHISSEGHLLYVLITQEHTNKKDSIKPDFT